MQKNYRHNNISDQLKTFTRVWGNPTDNKAVICLVHGLGEHIGRYEHFAKFFTDNNIAVIASDLRGHGQSEGTRGDAKSYNILLEQVDDLLQQADKYFPNLPKFIYGHSMGGNIALAHALSRQIKVNGIILSAPFLEPGTPIPAVKFMAGKLIGSIWGAFRLPNGLALDKLSRSPEVAAKYSSDPLVHDQISARWFFPAYQIGKDALSNIKTQLQSPMLIMHGSADGLTSFEASKKLAAQNPAMVTFKEWTGFYHELHNEPEQREVFQYTLAWIHAKM